MGDFGDPVHRKAFGNLSSVSTGIPQDSIDRIRLQGREERLTWGDTVNLQKLLRQQEKMPIGLSLSHTASASLRGVADTASTHSSPDEVRRQVCLLRRFQGCLH